LLGGDPGLGQQLRPEQLGQDGRIHLVVPAAGPRRSPYSGWDDQGGSSSSSWSSSTSQPSRRRLERHRGARRKGAKDRDQRGRVIGEVAVALGDTGVVHDGDLGALAKHVHPDEHTFNRASVPELELVPKPRLSG
jgi:hypothetical protein